MDMANLSLFEKASAACWRREDDLGLIEVQAEIAGGKKRDRLWTRLITLAPGYAGYDRKTKRQISVEILRPET